MDNTEKDMEAFRFMVHLLVEMKSPSLIENGSPAHARVILEEMAAAAKKSIYVFCGCIDKNTWGSPEMAASIERAFADKADIKFLVQRPSDIPADSPTVMALRRHEGSILDASPFASLGKHFAVFDRRMFRFEKDDAAKTAIASANRPEMAEPLSDLVSNMVAGQLQPA